ncbi:MAG TPA: hypothetical protein VEH84_16070 [Alphaproteobacteria bacterium]|nr:hypothetical protein [Alphaproteobacteria bacterium]
MTLQKLRTVYPFLRCAGLPAGWAAAVEQLGLSLAFTLEREALAGLTVHLRWAEDGRLAATAVYGAGADAAAVAAVRALCEEAAALCAESCTACGARPAGPRWDGWGIDQLCPDCAAASGLKSASEDFRAEALALAYAQPALIPDLIDRAYALALPDSADIAATLADLTPAPELEAWR